MPSIGRTVINLISRARGKVAFFRLFSDIRQTLVAQLLISNLLKQENITTELMYSKIIICVRLDKIEHKC